MPNIKNVKRFIALILTVSMVIVEFDFKTSAVNPVVVANNPAPAATPPSVPSTVSSGKPVSVESMRKGMMEIINPSKKTRSNPILRMPQELGPCGKTASDSVKAVYDPANDVLTIEGYGQMADYNELNFTTAPWANYSSNIDTVIIKDGVTSVGNFAFHSLTNLLKADISRTVKTIGEASFKGCSKLALIKFDSTSLLEIIGTGAFKNTGIVSLKLPDKLNEIGDDAFRGCQDLYCVTFGTTPLYIGNGAFSFCKNLYFMSYSANKRPSCSKSVFTEDMTKLKEIRVPNTCDYEVNDFCGISLTKVAPEELAKCMTEEEDLAKKVVQNEKDIKELNSKINENEKNDTIWSSVNTVLGGLALVIGGLTALVAKGKDLVNTVTSCFKKNGTQSSAGDDAKMNGGVVNNSHQESKDEKFEQSGDSNKDPQTKSSKNKRKRKKTDEGSESNPKFLEEAQHSESSNSVDPDSASVHSSNEVPLDKMWTCKKCNKPVKKGKNCSCGAKENE